MRVTRDTLLVNEGLNHLFLASQLAPDMRLPASLRTVTADVLRDLQDYRRDDYRDIGAQRHLRYDFRAAACAASVLLARAQELDPKEHLTSSDLTIGERLLLTLGPVDLQATAFYPVIAG